MSGGHFNYDQHRMQQIAEELDLLVLNNGVMTPNEWGEENGHDYPPAVIDKFKEAARTVRLGHEMVQAIDYLVCGDTGIESFRQQWRDRVGPWPPS